MNIMIISDVHDGDITVSENTTVKGIVTGDVTVESGANFVLNGIINGNVYFTNSSTGEIRGMVNGGIVNDGGDVCIYGTINGNVVEKSGKTLIDKQAVVRSSPNS